MGLGLAELAPLAGALVALLLRRWPAWGLVAGALVAWGLHLGWPPAWAPRAAFALAALAGLAAPARIRRIAWPALALAAAGASLWVWAGHREGLAAAAGVVGLAVAGIVPGELLARTAGRGAWAALAAAGLATSALIGLTGSVRLATEAALVWVPALGLLGREMRPQAARAAGLLLGAAAAQAVLLSNLGGWVVAPLLPLAAAAVGQRAGRRAGLLAAGAAALLAAAVVAPVAVAWLQDPPF